MKKQRVDRVLFGVVSALIVFGLLIFLSASLGLFAKEGTSFTSVVISQVVMGLGGGIVALLTALKIPLKVLRKYSPHLFGASLVATLLVFVPGLGITANGATRWIDLGFTTFQTSELLKVGYVLFVAAWFSGARGRASELVSGLLPFAVVTALVGGALLLQPDTDTFLIIAASGVAMAFAAGMQWKHLFACIAIGILLVGTLFIVRPYLRERAMTFFNPGRDLQGSGYQVNQSLIAIGSGELFGRGFGQSIQKFNYLPEATSDSIFAVYAEEFGFVGATILVLGFLTFALRGMWVAARAPDMFGGLLALGIVVIIVSQSFLNIGSMLGLLPVGGLPLVFVSHGGSALFIALGMVGLVLNVSRGVKS